MVSYWLSFRLRDSDGWERTYQDRLDALHAEIGESCGGEANWWFETTSFYVFKTAESVDTIIGRIRHAIAEEVDLVVLGMNDFKGGWIIGHLQDRDIRTLVPGMQKL